MATTTASNSGSGLSAALVAQTVYSVVRSGGTLRKAAESLGITQRSLLRCKQRWSEVHSAHINALREQGGESRLRRAATPTKRKEAMGTEDEQEMPILDLRGKKQPHGRLTAVSLVRVVRGKGAIWLCRCDCGNVRKVASKRFTAKEKGVTACEQCVDPERRKRQEQMISYLGGFYGLPGFEQEWRIYRSQFSELEWLLYATYVNGRHNSVSVQMQAVDIVIRCTDVKAELCSFSLKRVKEAHQWLLAHQKGGRS